MTIRVEFNDYDEMLTFCRQIVEKETPAVPDPEPAAVEEPAPEQEPEPIPFKEEPKPEPVKVKKEDVRKLLAAKKREGKDVSGVIRSFGVEMFKEIPEESYPELLKKVEEL